jgi:hypothetical protein
MSTIDTSKNFDQQIAEARTPAEIREICINREVAQGKLMQDRDGSVHVPVAEPAPAAPSMPADTGAQQRFSRVIYPGGNDRYEIFAESREALDAKEANIRAAYAGQQ